MDRLAPKLTSAAIALICGVLATGCTVSAPQDTLKSDVHLPLTYEKWSSKSYTTGTGKNVCSISSGYNGLTVTMGNNRAGKTEYVVSSNRRMQPSSSLRVNANGKFFETYETFFPPKIGTELVEALAHSDKAYLTWSEVSGPVSRPRRNVPSILDLGNFSAKLKNCQQGLGGGTPQN